MGKENMKTLKFLKDDRKEIGLKIFFRYLCIILCLLLTMTACSPQSKEDSSAENEWTATDQITREEPTSVSESSAGFDVSKIIYTGRISLNTDDYQDAFEKIKNYTDELDGFIQESESNFSSKDRNTQANSGYLMIRIPSDQFSEAMEKIQSFGSPISADVSSNNISQQYQDVETQLNNLRIQEQRLLELLREATNMADVLAIESELNRIRIEIDQLTSIKKNWDLEISYSTIYVSLYEKEISSTNVKSPFAEIFNRIGEGFVTSINLLLRIIAFLIVLVFSLFPFVAVALLGVYLFFKVRNKIKGKNKGGQDKLDYIDTEKQKDDESLKQ